MTKVERASGFELRELRVCGPGQPAGRLIFAPGLNVIEGASDTGKSYALSCIDFVMGAGTPPEEIPQAIPYDVAYLMIEAADGATYCLKRALAGGNVGLFRGGIEDALSAGADEWAVLGVTNKAQNSVSRFLLALCDLEGRKVRKNESGVTQDASFRVLAKALLVDEERIIAKRSPIYGHPNQDTAASSTIRMLLTGHDDSAIVQPEDMKTSAGRLAGRKETVESLIKHDESAIEELEQETSLTVEEAKELEASLRELSELSSAALTELRSAESRRRQVLGKQREARERLEDLDGMLARADLLDAHYQSDLLRLEAMGDAAHLLRMYSETACDYCGAEPEHHRPESVGTSPEATLEAARAEAKKVQGLRLELRVAVDQMNGQREELESGLADLVGEMKQVSAEIDEAITPQVRVTAASLRELQSKYTSYVHAAELRARLEALRQQLIELNAEPSKAEKLEFVKLTPNTMADVCTRIQKLLTAWGVANEITVAFDEKTADLTVNGRRRTSHGKGVRAVMCAGYVIGLMQQSLVARAGHPGFVVLDTPLNPYKEADADDDGVVATSVKDAFYRNLCATRDRGQVVVFENVKPPEDVRASCNHVHFSRSSAGRYGFLPVAAAGS